MEQLRCVDCAVMPIINPKKTAFLGYEFVATDMQSSSSYEDLCDELFSPLLGLLDGN